MLSALNMNDIVTFLVVIVPISTGITEAVKRNITIPSKYLPFVSVGVGLLAGLLYPGNLTVANRIIAGIIAGLGGIGGFEAVLKQVLDSLAKRQK